MRNLLLICLLASVSILACKTTDYSPKNSDLDQLTFGSGGGFSGRMVNYTLLESGHLFESNHDNYLLMGKVDKNKTKQLFESFNTFGFDKLKMDNPGNMYFYLGRNQSGKSHKITWGNLPKSNSTFTIYYANLMNMVKTIEPSCKTK